MFESADSMQEVACVSVCMGGVTYHITVRIHRKAIFFFLNVCGEGAKEQWKIDLSPKEQRCHR